MATSSTNKTQKKWIDLNDPNGASLKVGMFKGKLILVVTGVQPRSPVFFRAVRELGFTASSKGAHLIKACSLQDRIFPSQFHAVWPNAATALMDRDVFTLDLEGASARLAKKQDKADPTHAQAERLENQKSVADTLSESTYLGRNRAGDRIFDSLSGRFFVNEQDEITYESVNLDPPLFLRARSEKEIRECALGLLKACSKGEGQTKEKLNFFAQTVLEKPFESITSEELGLVARAVDSALLESLVENNDRPAEAWADAAYFDEMMVGRADFAADSVQVPFIPAPIAVQIQRYLTSATTISVAGKIPAIGFGLLPESTHVYVNDPQTLEFGNESFHRPFVESAANMQEPADGGYCRVSTNTTQAEIDAFFATMTDDAMCVMTSGSPDIGSRVTGQAQVLQSIKVPNWLSHTEKPIYVYVMKKGDAGDQSLTDAKQPTITSWNDLKAVVDESLNLLGKTEQASSAKSDYEREENRYQRPYKAFSKIGTASTMVPKNLQAGLGFALSALEDANGPIDQFVSDEIGVGIETLSSSFSPEQIDAIGLGIHRIQKGRGFILGDETGIGKGRSIAAIASWASKMGKPVIFITDKSNLFSDLARDLIDINEWDRFRPLITNADGQVLDIMGDAQVIATPPSPAEMKKILQGKEHNANIIFTTYSQINKDDSEKFKWLLAQAPDALVICDEAHIAAGSDSNIANAVQALVDSSWGVMYSSATWAKSSKNLHIYSRALPESVNISQVITSMKDGGESFGEVFSTMLSMDGAFIRREHDLSKIDFVVEIDNKYKARNELIAGQVSEILGMMALISGDINHALQKLSASGRVALQKSKEARDLIISANNSAINHELGTRAQLLGQIENAEQSIAQFDRVTQSQLELLSDRTQIDPESRASIRAIMSNYEDTHRMGPNTRDQFDEYNVARIFSQKFIEEDNLATLRQQLSELPELAPDEKIAKHSIFASSFGTGGAIYQVMRRTLAAISVDHTAEKAIAEHNQGRRPVIVFEETGEAFVRQLINEEIARIEAAIQEMREREASGELTAQDAVTKELADLLDAGTKAADLVREIRAPNLQDMLRKLLERLGGVRTIDPGVSIDEEEEESSLVEVKALTKLTDIPGIDQDVIERYMTGIQTITEKINQIPKLSIVPVDSIRAKLESAGITVGEISGRNYQLNPSNMEDIAQGTCQLVKRARKKSDVSQTVKKFNSAEFDVLIANRSAATGLSVHSSPRFPCSRQRVLLEFQSDENPTNRIQLFGRVNRFDQVVPPKILLMLSGLKGEMRTTMMQNKKLTNLSANIRSSRENAAVIEDVPDLLNSIGDRVCQEYLLENPGIATRLDIAMNRIKQGYSISHMLTQRTSLLSTKDQEKIYHDLTLAYEDAILQSSLSADVDNATERAWGAKTISQTHAWGPTVNVEALSAFDSPVYSRNVRFVHNYQPINWQDLRTIFKQANERLSADDRVKPLKIKSRIKAEQYYGLDLSVTSERRLDPEAKQSMWSKEVLYKLVNKIDREALEENESQNLFSEGDVNEEENEELFVEETVEQEDEPRATEQAHETDETSSAQINRIAIQFSRKPRGFESMAGQWLPVSVRTPGTDIAERMLCLVSKSGQSAKLWKFNDDAPATQYLININEAINSYDRAMVNFIKEIPSPTDPKMNELLNEKLLEVYGSSDPEIKRYSLEHLASVGSRVLEAKMVMALTTTSFTTLEEALMHTDHNAVKESHYRKLFLTKIIGQFSLGSVLTLEVRRGNSMEFLKDLVLADVQVPPAGEESLLSRWKFQFITPGDEKPSVMSGSMLYKMAGKGPLFDRLRVRTNILDPEQTALDFVSYRFDRFKKGPVTREKSLLVGNMFQASEWARATKRGRPIIYSDESGQRHRAIELNTFGRYAADNFPLRLDNRVMIKSYLRAILASETFVEQRTEVKAFTSFKAAIDRNSISAASLHGRDTLKVIPHLRQLAWMVDNDQRSKIQRALRAAVAADKKAWMKDNPNAAYPVVYQCHVQRRSSGKFSPILFALPETEEGLDRFMDIFIKTQGLQLYVPNGNSHGYSFAQRAEQAYYERLARPELEAQERMREIKDRNRQLFGAARGETIDQNNSQPEVKKIEVKEGAETGSQAAPTDQPGVDQNLERVQDAGEIASEPGLNHPISEIISEPAHEAVRVRTPIPIFPANRRGSGATSV